MNFLTNAYAQLIETLKPMSASAKVTTALLLAVVVVGVAFLFQSEQFSGDEYLLAGYAFGQEELSVALASFADAQLNDYTVENYKIRVPRNKRYQYVAAMSQANALPQTGADLWQQKFNGSLLESSEVRAWRHQYQKKRELERTLAAMSGLRLATVQFDVEQSNSLVGSPQKSCLVAVHPSSLRPVDRAMVRSVRESAAAWLNMQPEDVDVLDMFANRTYRGDSMGDFASGEDDYSSYKSIRENELTRKLYEQLDFIPGAKIAVQIELTPEVRHEVTSLTYSGKPTALETSAESEDETISSGKAGGRPGVAANNDPSGFANSAASVNGQTTETTRNSTREQQRSVIGQERTTREYLPFSPKAVTVSISVPKSYITKIWHQDNPPAEGEQPTVPDKNQLTAIESDLKTNIETIVNNLLPAVEAGVNPYPRVAFATYTAIARTPDPGPSQGLLMVEWLQDNWTSIAMGLIAIVGLVFLRGMVKSSQANAPSLGGQLGADSGPAGGAADSTPSSAGQSAAGSRTAGAEDPDEDELTRSLRDRYTQSGGPSLREELTGLVRDDPDSAAAVLGLWIGDH
jgi:flagellar M-ring protein FliF